MKPIFTGVAGKIRQEHSMDIKFHMVDADLFREIGEAYGVHGYPVRVRET